ncbi:Gfo/Idh/MocA family oxidoreductase [uncultured Cohaesibacter sp.]|uniref:Gfo/Idh/MocA family protein n=1 Tax=uncultured Cohaesibacter sp. TaxID=1002546 RepID=UPI0029C94438|nr:Gfo/Idh/MocA family oxidoreductase [uncultured Cohaesibacter sp.]
MRQDWEQIQFAAIGLDHGHIVGMTQGMLDAGARCKGYWTAGESDAHRQFTERFDHVERVNERARLLDDPSVSLVLIAAPSHDRAALAIEAMEHGKDVMVDKPGCISLEELRAIKATVEATGRIWSVNFSERFQVRAVSRASELIREGRIGKVVQMLGMGPHRLNAKTRPDWFFERERYGGILVDIASHQIDQFLYLTQSQSAEIVHSAVGNFAHPDWNGFEDFGEISLKSGPSQAYIRVDWLTPDALPTWGDGRLFILGTGGTIELRKYIDFCGRPGKDHLFLVNGTDYLHMDCSDAPLPYFGDLARDILERTETACPQAHTFAVMDLALKAQKTAEQRGTLAP